MPHFERHVTEEFGGVGPRFQVVGLLAVARVDVVPVSRGDLRLQIEDALRPRSGVTDTGQLEHPFHVDHEGVTNIREMLFAVVALVGERESTLFEHRHVSFRVTGVIVDEDRVEAADSAALEPAIVTLAVLYVMGWGYLQMMGRIEEPFMAGVGRIATLAIILAVALRLWLYNAVIVDTFYRAPAQLAAAVIGGSDPVGTIDAIWERGGAVADQLWHQSGLFSNFTSNAMAIAVWLLLGMLCVYVMFLIALASIASALLLAIGPLFVALLLFERSRRLFDAWLAQLANYALITILTVLAAALLLHVLESYVAQTAARAGALKPTGSDALIWRLGNAP